MTSFAWSAALVAEALEIPGVQWERTYSGVSIDTRSLKEDQLFVALKGERFDGHDFLGEARLGGVAGVVVRADTPRWPGFDWFEVGDTRHALGQLARFRRDRFEGPAVAITGTNGKTSTKEFIAAALGAKLRVHKSQLNLNNTIGVPLMVLGAEVEDEAMVIECGASLRGEIARMREIVRPDLAVVTNVDAGHLEGFGGSVDAVMEEKTSLLAGVKTAVVGTHPAALAERARGLATSVVTAGLEGADWIPENVVLDPGGCASFTVRGVKVRLPLPGMHMVSNALLALAVAESLGVDLSDAAGAIADTRIPGGRSEIAEYDGVTVINDSYNSNPGSLRAALETLAAVRADRRTVVVVGTMRELGAESERLHREMAVAVMDARPDVVVAIGEFAEAFAGLEKQGGPPIIAGETPETVVIALKARLKQGDVLLLKASRGVRLETMLPILWPEHSATEAH